MNNIYLARNLSYFFCALFLEKILQQKKNLMQKRQRDMKRWYLGSGTIILACIGWKIDNDLAFEVAFRRILQLPDLLFEH